VRTVPGPLMPQSGAGASKMAAIPGA
jgi:hypothetical protein